MHIRLLCFMGVELLAIDPITSKLLTHLAIKAAADAEARKRMLILILTPLIAVLLIITMFFLYPYTSFRVFGTIH